MIDGLPKKKRLKEIVHWPREWLQLQELKEFRFTNMKSLNFKSLKIDCYGMPTQTINACNKGNH